MMRTPLARWSWMAGAAALAVSASAIPASASLEDASCGLGLPPDAPGFARQQEQRVAEEKKNGFRRVCETDLERYSVHFQPMADARIGLAFEPVDLSRSRFARLESVGASPEAVGGTVSRFYRGFRTPEGQVLTLFEHDMSADSTSIGRDPKDEPERINGLPARLIVLQATSGKAVSVLSWLQGRRYLELWLEANAARDPLRRRLFELAASLPPSVPACPNEPPPKRVVLGADGFPEDDPAPRVLTIEQVETFNKPRPCK